MTNEQMTSVAALILRVALGLMLLAHGLLLKVLTFGVAGTAGYFESIGYPAALAYIVIAAEILGGLALILGIGTRIVSLALVPLMVGATLQHVGNGWLFSAANGGWEFPAFWTVALIVQALLGPGTLALRLGTSAGALQTTRA
ncbi:MAG: DoxX family protein [Pseudomonadota bacterium]